MLLIPNLDFIVDFQVIVVNQSCRYQNPSHLRIKIASADDLLSHIQAVSQKLDLSHLLRVPQANLAKLVHRNQLVLRIEEFKHDDLSFVSCDVAVGVLGGLVQDVNVSRHACISNDVKRLAVADCAYGPTHKLLAILIFILLVLLGDVPN